MHDAALAPNPHYYTLRKRPRQETNVLSEMEVDALVRARHGDRFATLGLHADVQGNWWIRAMRP